MYANEVAKGPVVVGMGLKRATGSWRTFSLYPQCPLGFVYTWVGQLKASVASAKCFIGLLGGFVMCRYSHQAIKRHQLKRCRRVPSVKEATLVQTTCKYS